MNLSSTWNNLYTRQLKQKLSTYRKQNKEIFCPFEQYYPHLSGSSKLFKSVWWLDRSISGTHIFVICKHSSKYIHVWQCEWYYSKSFLTKKLYLFMKIQGNCHQTNSKLPQISHTECSCDLYLSVFNSNIPDHLIIHMNLIHRIHLCLSSLHTVNAASSSSSSWASEILLLH